MTSRKPKKPTVAEERDARGVLEFKHVASTFFQGNAPPLIVVWVPLSLWHKARRTAKRMLK